MALEHIKRRAERIRKRRLELKYSQEGLADRMQEIHRKRNPAADPDKTRGQMVSDWERAINEPSPAKLELLAEALGWSVSELNGPDPEVERAKKAGPTPDPFAPGLESEVSELRDALADALRLLADVALEQAEAARSQGERPGRGHGPIAPERSQRIEAARRRADRLQRRPDQN